MKVIPGGIYQDTKDSRNKGAGCLGLIHGKRHVQIWQGQNRTCGSSGRCCGRRTFVATCRDGDICWEVGPRVVFSPILSVFAAVEGGGGKRGGDGKNKSM